MRFHKSIVRRRPMKITCQSGNTTHVIDQSNGRAIVITLSTFLTQCGIPHEQHGHTFFQWGSKPVYDDQPVRGALSVVSIDDHQRRISLDYSVQHPDGRTELLEVEVPLRNGDTLIIETGSQMERELAEFVQFVQKIQLLICGEA